MTTSRETKSGKARKVKGLRFWVQAAVIAGVYAALTIALAPVSYGPLQVRVSEALTILPRFTPAAIPGLFAGCLAANLISPYGLPDLIFGSAASLLAAFVSWLLRGKAWLVPLPPVIFNGLSIGAMLYYVYSVPPSLWVDMGYVALGEFLSCFVLGLPLMKYLDKHRRIFSFE